MWFPFLLHVQCGLHSGPAYQPYVHCIAADLALRFQLVVCASLQAPGLTQVLLSKSWSTQRMMHTALHAYDMFAVDHV